MMQMFANRYYLNHPKNAQRFLKLSQSGEISPNLVTLICICVPIKAIKCKCQPLKCPCNFKNFFSLFYDRKNRTLF